MATVTRPKAEATYPVYGASGGGKKYVVFEGTGNLEASPAAGDIYQMVRVPRGAVILGGRLFGEKLDSTGSGSALLDIDVGTLEAGTRDTDALGNFGVLSAAAVAGVKPEVGHNLPLGGLLLASGPITTTAETVVEMTFVASALAFATGELFLEVEYYVP